MPKEQSPFLQWNRPEEPGLEAPSFFLDPLTYVGGGVAGLMRKLATRAPTYLYHGAVLSRAKPPILTPEAKRASLERTVRSIQSTWQPKASTEEELMEQTYQRVVDFLNKMAGE